MSVKYKKQYNDTKVSDAQAYDILRSPVVSEKAITANQLNQYVFKVSPLANKFEIRSAVESIFGVKVSRVNTLKYAGKERRFRGVKGKTAGFKKAIITLKQGQTIDLGGNQ